MSNFRKVEMEYFIFMSAMTQTNRGVIEYYTQQGIVTPDKDTVTQYNIYEDMLQSAANALGVPAEMVTVLSFTMSPNRL